MNRNKYLFFSFCFASFTSSLLNQKKIPPRHRVDIYAALFGSRHQAVICLSRNHCLEIDLEEIYVVQVIRVLWHRCVLLKFHSETYSLSLTSIMMTIKMCERLFMSYFIGLWGSSSVTVFAKMLSDFWLTSQVETRETSLCIPVKSHQLIFKVSRNSSNSHKNKLILSSPMNSIITLLSPSPSSDYLLRYEFHI
jgi:hypothetical protein